MTESTYIEKHELLRRIEEGYSRIAILLASLSGEQLTTPEVNGNWSVKDNIAHLTVWQDFVNSSLQGLIAGQKPEDFLPDLPTEDAENAFIYEQNKDRPLSEVIAAFQASYQRLLETIQGVSEEQLNAPYPWSEKKENPVWRHIAGNTFEHYEEHSAIIQSWLQARTV